MILESTSIPSPNQNYPDTQGRGYYLPWVDNETSSSYKAGVVGSGLSEIGFRSLGNIEGNARYLPEALKKDGLGDALAQTLIDNARDDAHLMRRAASPEEQAEAERGLRDLDLTVAALSSVLGFSAIMDVNLPRTFPVGYRSGRVRNGGPDDREHVFKYAVAQELLLGEDLGDLEIPIDQGDLHWHIQAELTITIDPSKRIDINYRSKHEKARAYHSAEDVTLKDGKLTHHAYDGFSIRIDLDDKSPVGIAIDVGRDDTSTDAFMRDPDLAGTLGRRAKPESGSHNHRRLTEEMRGSFRENAETLVVQLALAQQQSAHDNASRYDSEEALRNKLDFDMRTGRVLGRSALYSLLAESARYARRVDGAAYNRRVAVEADQAEQLGILDDTVALYRRVS